MQGKPDRRVRRTRRLVYEALISLIPEKGYEHITVQDILDRADVGRSTFYAHFRDKDDLLISGFDELSHEIRRQLDSYTTSEPAGNPVNPTEALFEHVHRHQHVYRALAGRRGGSVIHRHLHRLISDLLRPHLQPHVARARTDIPIEVLVEFLASSLLGLLTWWLDHDSPYSPSQIARMYHQLATPGLRTVLNMAHLVDAP